MLYLVYSAFRGEQIPEAVISGVPRSADAAAVRQGALQALYGGFPGTVNVKALEMGDALPDEVLPEFRWQDLVA